MTARGRHVEPVETLGSKFSKISKQLLRVGKEDFPDFKLLNNIWDYSKDGKHYVKNLDEKLLRK